MIFGLETEGLAKNKQVSVTYGLFCWCQFGNVWLDMELKWILVWKPALDLN